jgi:hypothetical protein
LFGAILSLLSGMRPAAGAVIDSTRRPCCLWQIRIHSVIGNSDSVCAPNPDLIGRHVELAFAQ